MEWTEFHEQIEALPEEEREVFNLVWYQQLTHEQAAEVLGVTTRTVRRRWQDARYRLCKARTRRAVARGMTMTTTDDQFRDLLDRWEELREQGQEPSVEELCRDAPHLAERLREWTRVLRTSDWMCQRADEVADETFGEAGVLTAEERDRHRTLGEYTLLEELGGGGMGRVFKAVHRKMNRTVAVKLLPESPSQSPESVERFQREIRCLPGCRIRTSSPSTTPAQPTARTYYVMDLVDGGISPGSSRSTVRMPVEQAVD